MAMAGTDHGRHRCAGRGAGPEISENNTVANLALAFAVLGLIFGIGTLSSIGSVEGAYVLLSSALPAIALGKLSRDRARNLVIETPSNARGDDLRGSQFCVQFVHFLRAANLSRDGGSLLVRQ